MCQCLCCVVVKRDNVGTFNVWRLMCEKNEKQCYVKQEKRKRKHEQKEWDPEKEKQQTMWKERRGLQILPATVLSAVVSALPGR